MTSYHPWRYFLLTNLLTAVLWLSGEQLRHHGFATLYLVTMFAGLVTPFLLSVTMLWRPGPNPQLKDFAQRLLALNRLNLPLLAGQCLLMPAVIVTAVLLSCLWGESWSQLQFATGFSFSPQGISVLLLLLLAAVFEELGWRGYAFDSLASHCSLLPAALLFGVLWSLWHVPLMWVSQSYQWQLVQQDPWYALNFYLGIIPLGVILTWVCQKHGKSIPAAIIFHFIVNLSQELFAITQKTKIIETGVLFLLMLIIISGDRQLFSSASIARPRKREALG